jgi:hypothetical protein
MSYDVSTRLDYLGERMQELHQNELLYIRGEETVEIKHFTPEKIDVQELAAFGIAMLTDRAQDFVFDTESLQAFDSPVPLRGDKIRWNGRLYELFSIGDEIYRYTTSTRKRVRVHSRQIDG